mgnify:FL=1
MRVIVLMATYNHEKTIERAIQSVLNQVDDKGKPFSLQLMIHDDGSTDRTKEIILEKYSNVKEVLFFSWGHKGLMYNYYMMFSCAYSPHSVSIYDYIAFCDGDDYWIDPLKLQRQTEFMNANLKYSLCITKVMTQNEGSNELIPMDVDANFINRVISFDTVLMGNAYIHAQSYLLRASYFYRNIDFYDFCKKGFKLWDLPIILQLVKDFHIYCLDFYSAVFYKQKESVTNTHSRIKRLRYILAVNKIKWYYVKMYGCQSTTKFYLIYKFMRDVYSIIFGRWYK